MIEETVVQKLPHHEQKELCRTRAPYRQGKKLTAIKVYTINNESTHLIVSGVPKLDLIKEVKKLFFPYGEIKKLKLLPDYPSEKFTETFHIHYARIQSARIAKRFIDGKNFYGGILHLFYAPELESLSETRAKLMQRHKDVTVRIQRHKEDPTNPEIDEFVPVERYERRKKTPALPLTKERFKVQYPNGHFETQLLQGSIHSPEYSGASTSTGITLSNRIEIPKEIKPSFELVQVPYQAHEAIIKNTESLRRRNYKGQNVDNTVKVRRLRPQLIDTRRIAKKEEPEKNVFINVKKSNNKIKIRILPRTEEKKIIIKDPSVTQLVRPSHDLKYSIEIAKKQIRLAMHKN